MTDYTQAGAELAANLANEVAIVPHTFRAHQFQNDLVYPERAAFGKFCAQVLEERAAPSGVRTPASDQAAVDMLNSRVGARRWNIHDLVDTQYPSMICLSEHIAVNHALRREAMEREARIADLQASYDAAVKDLREIGVITKRGGTYELEAHEALFNIQSIAAKYRVETDPLVEAMYAAGWSGCEALADELRPHLRGIELAKRGVTV